MSHRAAAILWPYTIREGRKLRASCRELRERIAEDTAALESINSVKAQIEELPSYKLIKCWKCQCPRRRKARQMPPLRRSVDS